MDEVSSKSLLDVGSTSGGSVDIEMAEVNGSEEVLDVAWMNSLRNKCLATGDGASHKQHLIYRVHQSLRHEKDSYYEPLATSIGPYHRGKKHLQAMEKHKRRYLCQILSQNEKISFFEDLLKMIKKKEEQVRQCYSENIDLKSNEFVEMILLDGCFIVQYLLNTDGGSSNDEFINGPGWMENLFIFRDMLLLENQLPFFILQDILEMVEPTAKDNFTMVDFSLRLLKSMMWEINEKIPPMPPNSFHHLLHLLHTYLIPTPTIPKTKSMILKLKSAMTACIDSKCFKSATVEPLFQLIKSMPNATKLKESGVEFKVRSKSLLLDTTFCNGVMEIPHITIHEDTEVQLRNLVAFEQCCLGFNSYYFSNYITFMDCIINTSKDVEILHREGILTHELGSDEDVAVLVNNLRKGVLIDYIDNDTHLSEMVKEVTYYCNSRAHKWRASIVHDYCYSPCAVLSILAAFLILSLTAIQTVFSILSYVHRKD